MARKNAQPSAASPSPGERPAGSAARLGIFVGIGGSAGALEALHGFFDHMPADTGMVFVVVMHLERHHPSVLAELLARHTEMPVTQAEDGVRARPDRVYVIAPNTVLALERGVLRVATPEAVGSRKPVDTLLGSLADDQGEGAVGIILSGTGADGTIGMRMIREHGGLTLAQAPDTAKYADMPQSVIGAGLADHVLRVEDMPARLRAHADRLAQARRSEATALDDEIAANLDSICGALQRQTGHDFSHYKKGTLLRRIGRRINVMAKTSVPDYLRRLESEPAEAESLLRDLLIGVTHFFRDPEAFQALADLAIPRVLERAEAMQPLRAWVPGCASGEEAYSIAMLLLEQLSRQGDSRPVQVFGTDIDTELLKTARQGRYPDEIRAHVSPGRLERFFTRDGASFQISKELRQSCTFSTHSLIKDPPFSSLDLISCRNVLIYLGPELQKRLVPVFHFSLRSGGFLFLGPSEDLAANAEMFVSVDKRYRIFRRNEAVARRPLDLPMVGRTIPTAPQPHPDLEPAAPPPERTLSPALDRMIRSEYAPPCVVVNEQGEILYLGGPTSRYLQPREGRPTHNLFDQAPTGLRVELRAALSIAVKTHSKVVREHVLAEVDGSVRPLRLTARPLPGLPPQSGLYAVIMQETGAAEAREGGVQPPARELLVIEQLEDELRQTREDLQSAMESLETSNEELKSTNEELTSTNEELQSANEELQSSREELQTVNDELREKVQALDAASNDLQNHYAGTQIATLFLDRELRITSSTPAAGALFRFAGSEAGRSFHVVAAFFKEQCLAADVQDVLRTEEVVERHMQTADGRRWFLVRLLPYRTTDQLVAGVGITCIDITDLHRAEAAERHYGLLSDAIFVWSFDGGLETWSRGAEELYGYASREVRGRPPYEVLRTLLPRRWREIRDALHGSGRWEGELEHRTKDGRAVAVSAKLELTRGEDGVERVLEADRDISDRKRAEEALRNADRNKNEFLAVLSHELRNPLAPIRNSLHVLQQVETGGDEARRALTIADRQLGQLTHLVDDLLDVTRITRNKIHLQRQRLDLNELVRHTVDDNHSTLEASGMTVEIDLAPAPVLIDADPVRISQVLGNLLQNAAKFTPRGGVVRVSVSTDPGSTRAVLRVTDSGIGMEPETLACLFQPFMQAKNSLDRSVGGLGLGLALVKGLVDLHGGEVTATSEGLGRGSSLLVSLPITPLDAPVLRPGPADQEPCSRRVLIIEDNVDTAESLRMALEIEGHEVAAAYDGPNGIELARRFRPEILLCDIGLPGMGGYEVAAAFRSDPALQGTFRVALTGRGLPEDVQQAIAGGFDRHLTKPPKFEQLRQVIASVPSVDAAPGNPGPGGSEDPPPGGMPDRA
jgi:two-component system CheB/CheR fusion protein